MRFDSDAQPLSRRAALPLAVLVSGLLWGLDGLIRGEDRLLVTLIAVGVAHFLWRFLSEPTGQGEPA